MRIITPGIVHVSNDGNTAVLTGFEIELGPSDTEEMVTRRIVRTWMMNAGRMREGVTTEGCTFTTTDTPHARTGVE